MKNQIYTTEAPSLVAHHFRSKFSVAKKALVIAGYDYFLQKADLQRLLRTYSEVLLIPDQTDAELLVGEKMLSSLKNTEEMHLVVDPFTDTSDFVDFVKQQHENIVVFSMNEFCVRFLRKVYVPAIPHLPYLDATWIHPFPPNIAAIKRFMDVVVSSLLIILSLPIWLISALKIATESPGRVFYTQKRMGLKNREFKMIKFRSMIPNAETNGAVFSKKNDKRVFRYGKFMRITRIDELPQLINVLRGDLSLVGPRPERKVFVDQFREEMPHYDFRNVVTPGISGYAQIAYPYGAGAKDARHKLMYDLYYIKHWSIGLELRIMWLTVVTILSKQGM